ncbi:hypothetical protein CEE69_26625 [Rhodopirellula bahusiensis]|uniref:Uncharacterized protein n=1 Tax=Rhodopirellula bahusiensis TaxID=2014065 RepID=A0A2G1W0U9_9BACT|nr:hypothetical protein CEE69_26625 [Rhodopirellula bahusiensis]
MNIVNPYDSASKVTAQLDSGRGVVRTFVAPFVLGIASGFLVFVFTMVTGVHGGMDTTGYYVYGPPIWMARLDIDEITFVVSLAIASCLMWVLYWWFILRQSATPPVLGRVLIVIVLHVTPVGVYHATFGLPKLRGEPWHSHGAGLAAEFEMDNFSLPAR